ncbi:MAG: efflux RND transporter permease subunit [Chitinispirillaceae bacterium]
MVLTNISIKKPVMMLMVIAAFIIFGVIGFLALPIDLMPNVEVPFVTVRTIYPGAGPEEIETSVIKPLEEQMATIPDVKNISSFANEGVGFIILEFNLGVDPDLAAIDVKDKTDAILFELPEDLLKPVISKFDINEQPIINLALTGPVSAEKLRVIADKRVKDELVKIGGVANVDVRGGREREIRVLLDKNRMDALKLNYQTVAGVIASQTVSIPGGHVSGTRKEYTVRVEGEFTGLDEIRNLGIPVNGSVVPLHTFADVVDGYEEMRELARFDRKNSVGLAIYKRPDANTVRVAKEIHVRIKQLGTDLPSGVNISVAQDRSEYIEESVNDMYRNLLIGMGLTALMLFLFLGDWRVTIIAAATIPASVVITFAGMNAFGFSLNIMTLMALAISVGTLVTNAIIVLENIVRHRDTGMPVRKSAEVGANEVAIAVLASVLTNVAVFAPMANMEGITGQFFVSLGLTIVTATLVSLFLSFTFAPLAASRILSTRSAGEKKHLLQPVLDSISNLYSSMLDKALRFRKTMVAAAAVLFALTLFLIGPRVGMEMFPQSDQGIIYINLEMPSGTSLEESNRALETIEKRVSELPDVKSMYASLGGSGINTGVNHASVTLQLKDRAQREASTASNANRVRHFLTDIPGARIVVSEAEFMSTGSEGDISVEVTGDEMEEILALTDSVKVRMKEVPGLVDIQTSWKEAKPEVKFVPKRMLVDEYHTNVATMGTVLRGSLTGNEVALFREENDEYNIRLMYSQEDRENVDAVENISVPTPRGMVPIKVLSEVRREGGAASIQRKNRQRLVTVSVNVSSGAVGTVTEELQELVDQIEVKPGYRIYFGGQQEIWAESLRTLLFTIVLAIVLTFLVLAGSIESLTQPFIIMLTLPLGLIGVLWALFLSGKSISMLSLMSMVMLVGVVVNNAILIIDYAHKQQREGLNRFAAISRACKVKFNVILMMNLAVVLALLPQALDFTSFQAPFAITAIGGITVSMVMTLFVIPSLYVLGEKRKVSSETA